MKIVKRVETAYTYTIELPAYDAIQLADILDAVIEQQRQVDDMNLKFGKHSDFAPKVRAFVSPQEMIVAIELRKRLSEQINDPVFDLNPTK